MEVFVLKLEEVSKLKAGLHKSGRIEDYKEACELVTLWDKVQKGLSFNDAKITAWARENLSYEYLTNCAINTLTGIHPKKLLGYNLAMNQYDTIESFLQPNFTFITNASNGIPQFEDEDGSTSINLEEVRSYTQKATGAGLTSFVKSKGERVKLRAVKYNGSGIDIVTPTDDMDKDTKVFKPFYGIELEAMCRRSAPRDIVRLITREALKDFAIVKSDSSVAGRGTVGFEIVSVPATYSKHKEVWRNFFNPDTGVARYLKSWTTNKCGIHIHVSRDAFTKPHLARFVCFLNDAHNRDFICDIAGRNPTAYAKLQPAYRYGHIMSNERANISGDRHSATNLQNEATVEVRIFRGNTREKGFFKNLEFVDAVYYFTQSCGWKYDMTAKRSKIVYEDFLAWIDRNNFDYSNLVDWLKEKEYLKGVRRTTGKDKQQLQWRNECA